MADLVAIFAFSATTVFAVSASLTDDAAFPAVDIVGVRIDAPAVAASRSGGAWRIALHDAATVDAVFYRGAAVATATAVLTGSGVSALAITAFLPWRLWLAANWATAQGSFTATDCSFVDNQRLGDNAKVPCVVFIALVADELAVLLLAGIVWPGGLATAAATVRILDPQILEAILAAPRVVFLLVLIALVISLSLVLFLVLLSFLVLLGTASQAGSAKRQAPEERAAGAEESAAWGLFGQGAVQFVKPVVG
jgi:hypothetical protein